jgi:hypothetical protein
MISANQQQTSPHAFGVRDTSLDAFVKLKDYLAESQIEIYKAIVEHPHSTRNEVSEYAGKTINNTCGRVKELINLGLVIEGQQREFWVNNVKTMRYELMAVRHIDWNLLEIKKLQKRETIKISKKHLPTISYLLNFIEKKAGCDIELLAQHGNPTAVRPILDLKVELQELLDKLQAETPFFHSDVGYAITWNAKSETGEEETYYNIEYIKSSGKISCSCKDFKFRHRKCKHIKSLSKKLKKMGLFLVGLNEERFENK